MHDTLALSISLSVRFFSLTILCKYVEKLRKFFEIVTEILHCRKVSSDRVHLEFLMLHLDENNSNATNAFNIINEVTFKQTMSVRKYVM